MSPFGVVTCTAELPSNAEAVGKSDSDTLESVGRRSPRRTRSRNPKSTMS
jgi:hypothetical protein